MSQIKTNNEREVFNTSENAVLVNKINGDGNCLFAALAHQLFGDSINSGDHQQNTRDLRRQTTNFLKENIEDHKEQLLEGIRERSPRYEAIVQDDGSPKEKEQILALLQDLEKEGFWGGGESIAAISNIYKATIVIYFERGPSISIRPVGDSVTTLRIAYRQGKGQTRWNHYDSIIRILDEVGGMNSMEDTEMVFHPTVAYVDIGSERKEVGVSYPADLMNKTWLASWNVRGCSAKEKRDNIDTAMADLKISIACLQETHLATGSSFTDNYNWYHSGEQDSGAQYRGTGILIKRDSNIKVNKFIPTSDSICMAYLEIGRKKCTIISTHVPSSTDTRYLETWSQLKKLIGRQEAAFPDTPITIAGDFNAHIGILDLSEDDKQYIGNTLKHKKCNENGRQLKLLAQLFGLNILTTSSKSKTVLTTWTNGKSESQLDHILARKEDKNIRIRHTNAKTIKEVSTDHKLIRAEIYWQESTEEQPQVQRNLKTQKKWNLERLKIPSEKLNFQLYAKALRYQDTPDNMEQNKARSWDEVVLYTQQAAAAATLNKPSSPNTPGRRKTTAAMLKAQYSHYRKPEDPIIKARLKAARVNRQKAYRDHEDRKYENFFQNIIKLHPLQRLHQTYKFLKKNKNKRKQKYIPMSKWQEELVPQGGKEIEPIIEVDHWPLSRPATEKEIENRVNEWKPNSAPGLDRISAEMLKAAPNEIKRDIVDILTRAWIENEIPEQWTTTIQVPIPKIQNPKTTKDFRRITLCSIAYKLHAKHILKTLDDCTETLPDYQAAFLPNRSVDDHVFTTRRILEEDWRSGKRNYVLALDLEKAFDSVDHAAIVTILKHQKVPQFLINRIIKACLYEVTAILWYGQVTDFKRKKTGVKQGCPLSPRLFTWALHEAIETTMEVLPQFNLTQNNMTSPILLAYADDILIIAEEEEDIHILLKELVPNLESVGLKLNWDKCQIMIKDPMIPKEGGKNQSFVIIGDFKFQRVNSLKYLGTILTSDLNRPDTTKPRIKKAYQAMYSMLNSLGNNKLTWNVMRTLYNTVIAPTALHGIKTAALTKANRTSLRQMEREIIQVIAQRCRKIPPKQRIAKLLNGKTINKKIMTHRLRYWAHIIRRENRSMIGAALSLRAPYKKIGRPCFTWNDSLKRDLKKIPSPPEGWREIAKDKSRTKKESKVFFDWEESSDSESSDSSIAKKKGPTKKKKNR